MNTTGGKLALVQRPPAVHNDSSGSVGSQGAELPSAESASLGSSYMRASRLSSSHPGGHTGGEGDPGKGSKWIEEAAKGLWKEEDVDVEWDASTRSKLLWNPSEPQTAASLSASAKNSNGSHSLQLDEKSSSPHAVTRAREDAPGVEGPEKKDEEDCGMQDVGVPLHLMPGNGTGDEFLDKALQEEGVRFTGDDRPFGMPGIPVKSPKCSAAGNARTDEMPVDSGADVERKDAVAAEDASKFGKVYEVFELFFLLPQSVSRDLSGSNVLCLQEYLKRKGKDVDPTLVEQMRGIIILSCCQNKTRCQNLKK